MKVTILLVLITAVVSAFHLPLREEFFLLFMEQNAQFLGGSGHCIFVLNDHEGASHPSLSTRVASINMFIASWN